jgi:hypothetical protein
MQRLIGGIIAAVREECPSLSSAADSLESVVRDGVRDNALLSGMDLLFKHREYGLVGMLRVKIDWKKHEVLVPLDPTFSVREDADDEQIAFRISDGTYALIQHLREFLQKAQIDNVGWHVHYRSISDDAIRQGVDWLREKHKLVNISEEDKREKAEFREDLKTEIGPANLEEIHFRFLHKR